LSIIVKLRSWLGYLKGYGHCFHCRGTWDFKETFTITDSPNTVVFPICVDCAKKLSEEQILKYVMDVYDWWVREGWKTREEVNARLSYIKSHRTIAEALNKLKEVESVEHNG
jgi:hypothetical protein